ncbi:hypothetical protein OGCDGJMD_01242 [Cyanobium usitatum str. Tous]|uniref:hypothetical protein n=1 Tax=Cyanobium usitatum TaxID=2304190 RepID=UPI002AD1EF2E|nr:hypothetical protein [Cyanobium usitatum]CAK6692486.1 hypothetical protein OGCDGJMD_01242 [Cyanobium usitatum str. Tous]
MNLTLLEPSDADLQRAWDLLQANGKATPTEYARAVLRRWGVVVAWLPTPPESEPNLTAMTRQNTSNPCSPAEQQARQDRLEQAYAASGRSCGTYTGLFAELEGEVTPAAEEAA